jgi:hypothetical protein
LQNCAYVEKEYRPPPKNENPGAVATATGADRKADVLKEPPTKYLSFVGFVQSENAAIVCVGQQLVGTIIKSDGRYDAFDLSRRCLGSFRKRINAVRATRCGAVS